MNTSRSKPLVTRFINCKIFRDGKFIDDDLWVHNGIIVDPRIYFYRGSPDKTIDCKGLKIVPGLIDVQINGAFGIDFTTLCTNYPDTFQETLHKIARGLFQYGVTAFCPTIVTSELNAYPTIIKNFKKFAGNKDNGATNLGLHLEGPFINPNKAGAHSHEFIQSSSNYMSIFECNPKHSNIAIVTVAPELDNAMVVIKTLSGNGIVVSMGHSTATFDEGVKGLHMGAKMITHLFNAMGTVQSREPGLIGLISSDVVHCQVKLGGHKELFYSLIVDGFHVHPAVLRMAHSAHPKGSILVTDAIAAMGLLPGEYHLGNVNINVSENNCATVLGTNILAGSVTPMNKCVQQFSKIVGLCAAIESATLHPAQLLGIQKNKGTLSIGSDADFIIINDEITIYSTYIAGEETWHQ